MANNNKWQLYIIETKSYLNEFICIFVLIKRFLSSSVNTLSLQNLERSVYIYLHILRQYFIINARKTRRCAQLRVP